MIVAVSVMVVVALVFGASIAMAAKPDGSNETKNVIAMSNGFPSGMHFNLNIHGKKADFDGDPEPGGKSVFILEYSLIDGESEPIPEHIQYVSNKKASVYELTVLDPLAEYFDGDPAKVQLPYKVMVDDTPTPAEGYYVFARILGKPNNSSNDGDPSSIILYPNVVVEACNDPGNEDFGDLTNCPDDPLLALGLIIKDAVYEATPEEFVRFDPATTSKGKGKSKAVDITPLFTYAGWVVDARLDTSGPEGVPDGVIDEYDVPSDYTGDSIINADDIEPWLNAMAALDPPMAWYFEGEWILNIADLVITEQGLVNDGTKLLQVRFYPVDTTEFTPK